MEIRRILYYVVIITSIILVSLYLYKQLIVNPTITSKQLIDITLTTRFFPTKNVFINLIMYQRIGETILFLVFIVLIAGKLIEKKHLSIAIHSVPLVLIALIIYSDQFSGNPVHALPRTSYGYFENYILLSITLLLIVIFIVEIMSLNTNYREILYDLRYLIPILIISLNFSNPLLYPDVMILYITLLMLPYIIVIHMRRK